MIAPRREPIPSSPSRRVPRRSSSVHRAFEKSAPARSQSTSCTRSRCAAPKSARAEFDPSTRALLEVRDAEVRVVEAAVARGHHAPVRAAQLDARRPAVDETHPVERGLREVAAREVAAHELDVDQPGPGEVVARVPAADHSHADRFAVVVELESGEFGPVVGGHAAILHADVGDTHAASTFGPPTTGARVSQTVRASGSAPGPALPSPSRSLVSAGAAVSSSSPASSPQRALVNRWPDSSRAT